MDFVTTVSFISSIASLALAVVAIWLALHHKKESDAVNADTKKLLMEVGSDAKVVSAIAMPELKAYGESMRKLVFEIKNPSEHVLDTKSIEEIKVQLESLRSENQQNGELSTKIDSIERLISEQQNKGLGAIEINDDYILIDLSIISAGVMTSSIDQFETVQDLLDTLWLNFLNKEVPSYTYGKRWIIRDSDTREIISTPGRDDNRPLSEAGILGGVHYFVELLDRHGKSFQRLKR